MIDLRPDLLAIVQEILQQHVPACEVRAFGSRQKWTAKETSDLDLVVVGPQRIQLKTMAALKEAFEESILPMRVDVLDWNAISPEFQRVIEESFEVIQGGEVSPLAPVSSFAVAPERSRRAAAVSSATPLSGAAPRNAPKDFPVYCGGFVSVKLGVVAKVRSGFAFKSSDMGNVGSPIIKIKNVVPPTIDISECDRIPSSVIDSISDIQRFSLRCGDILIAMTGATVGKVGRFPNTNEQHFINQRVGKVYLSNSKLANYQYLYYILSQGKYVREMFGAAEGSAQANISGSQIESLSIPLPPLPIQKAIAHILGTLDDRIELCRRMNETLEAMTRALFKDWFIDFGPVRAKMEGREPPGLSPEVAALFPSKLVDSELGEIPEGWEISTIGDEVRAVGGGTPSTKESELWENGSHFWATPKDLSKLQFPVILETERKITDAGLTKISSGLLPVGTLLLSSRAPIGYMAITEIPLAINQGFIAMICDKRISNIFAYFWCKENMDRIVGNANGSTFQEISKSNFRPLSMIIPSKGILNAFSDSVRDIHQQIVANQVQAASLSTLRDTLLPKLLSGELSVSEAMLQLEAA